jgi:hypothetical protein
VEYFPVRDCGAMNRATLILPKLDLASVNNPESHFFGVIKPSEHHLFSARFCSARLFSRKPGNHL